MTMLPRGSDATAGFTLLELLVVLTILALLAALAGPVLTSGLDRARLRAAGEDVAAALRIGRAAAIAANGEVSVVIDADSRTVHRDGAPVQRLALGLFIRLTVAESERATPTRGGFRFFGNGSSTGGDIILDLRGKELRLCVDWLTGRVAEGPKC